MIRERTCKCAEISTKKPASNPNMRVIFNKSKKSEKKFKKSVDKRERV